MRFILILCCLLCSTACHAQHRQRFAFDAVVSMDGKDITAQSSFYVTGRNLVYYPVARLNYYEFNFADSIADVHLLTKDRHYIFRGVETFYAMRNGVWTISLNSLANDTTYVIWGGFSGCGGRPLLGGRNYLFEGLTNKIQLHSVTSRQRLKREKIASWTKRLGQN